MFLLPGSRPARTPWGKGRIAWAAMSQWSGHPTPKHTLLVIHYLARPRAEPLVTNADGLVVGSLSRARETPMYGAGR